MIVTETILRLNTFLKVPTEMYKDITKLKDIRT